jgi:hypothetical protein
MDHHDPSQSPRGHRANVLLTAAIESDAGSVAVKLRNLSALGALIVGEELPRAGTAVTFCRNDLRVGGRIAWVDGSTAGIAFGKPLEAKAVLRHIAQPRARAALDHWRPGFTSRV